MRSSSSSAIECSGSFRGAGAAPLTTMGLSFRTLFFLSVRRGKPPNTIIAAGRSIFRPAPNLRARSVPPTSSGTLNPRNEVGPEKTRVIAAGLFGTLCDQKALPVDCSDVAQHRQLRRPRFDLDQRKRRSGGQFVGSRDRNDYGRQLRDSSDQMN